MSLKIFNNWCQRKLATKKRLGQCVKKIAELESDIAQKQAIFDAQSDAVIVSDAQGVIVMINKQTEILFGYTTAELVGQSVDILVPSRFREHHRQYRETYCIAPTPRLMGGGFLHIMVLCKDLTEVDVEIGLIPIETEQGFLFHCSLRDVTTHKKFEMSLKASEERFRLIANNSPIMIWLTDRNGTPIFSNKAWLDFVGAKLSPTMTHKEWRNLVHPDDVVTVLTSYYQNIKARSPVSVEYRLRHISGEWRWVFDQGVPIFNDLGIFTGYIGSLVDITEQKNFGIESRIAAIAFESNEPIVITDSKTIILRVNKAFTLLTGYSAEECIGNTMNFLHSGHHDEAFYQTMWQILNQEGSWRGEIWDRGKNGEIYPTWLTITAVTDKNGLVTNYVGMQSDITERKAEEKKIRNLAYYDPLTQLPNRRLLHERMEQSLIMAQRQNKQLGVLMLDLDKFKAVNDTLGHLAGDELLQQVARRLSALIRESDTLARLGGDEFIVVLENITHPVDAALVAKNIVFELKKPFDLTLGKNVRIGASVGISIYPQNGFDATQLILNADLALYQAKAKGRGCFAYFSE
jgi:diguanylate cyclase (GGDEF)-like protein/PAS domain S-box-containing protein